MNKIIILGWMLLPCNIIGLSYCVYTLQGEIRIDYIFAACLFIAQIIYIAKTLQILRRLEISRQDLESFVRKASLTMTKISKGKNEEKGPP